MKHVLIVIFISFFSIYNLMSMEMQLEEIVVDMAEESYNPTFEDVLTKLKLNLKSSIYDEIEKIIEENKAKKEKLLLAQNQANNLKNDIENVKSCQNMLQTQIKESQQEFVELQNQNQIFNHKIIVESGLNFSKKGELDRMNEEIKKVGDSRTLLDQEIQKNAQLIYFAQQNINNLSNIFNQQ